MRTLRVFINTLSVNPGHEGIRTVLTRLVPALVRVSAHHHYALVCSRSNVGLFEDIDDAVARIVLPVRTNRPLLRILHDQTSVPFLARWRGADVLFTPTLVGAVLATVPQVLTVQSPLAVPSLRREAPDYHPSLLRHLYEGPLMRLSHSRAASVAVISEYLRRLLVEETGLDDPKTVAILNGVDQSESLSSPKTPAYALFVGTLYPYKNVGTAIRALGRARNRLPEGFRLVIAGPDPDGRQLGVLATEAQRSGVADRVDLLGGVYGAELEELYRGATMLILPSLIEGFGLPVLEAMVRGVPVIAADRTALPEVVGGAGLLFHADDPDDLAEHMTAMVDDVSLRSKLVEAGIRRARELSWDQAAVAYSNLFERVGRSARSVASHAVP
jgi:glycosyltransferase involved in cell wall biosynthesis